MFKPNFWVQNHLWNLCSRIANLQKLSCSQKTGLKCSFYRFLVYKNIIVLFCFQIVMQILKKDIKILLLPPKYEIIMLPSHYSFFQYWDSNIRLFSIAPCKVITLNPFWYQFFASFLMALSLKLSLFQVSR